MKLYRLAIVFFLFSNAVFCQTIEKEELYGIWKVEKNLTNISDPKFKDVIDGFRTSTFRFEENGNFELKSPNKSKLFLMTLEMTKNKKWQFDNKRQLIKIGSSKDGFSIIGIEVTKIEGKIFFKLSETPLEFEMSKVN